MVITPRQCDHFHNFIPVEDFDRDSYFLIGNLYHVQLSSTELIAIPFDYTV